MSELRELCRDLLNEVRFQPLIIDKALIARAELLLAQPATPGASLSALLSPGYEQVRIGVDGDQFVDGEWWHPVMGCESLQHVVDNARAAAQPAPPAEGEVADLVEWLRETGDLACQADAAEGQRYWAVAALLQQQRPSVTLPDLPYAESPEMFPYGSEGYVGWVAGRASGWHGARQEVERQQAGLSLATDSNQPHQEPWDMSTADGSRCFASAILSRLVGIDKASAEDAEWLAAYLQVNCRHPRVTLPKDPPEQFACWLKVEDPGDDGAKFDRGLVTSVWAAARREVERQQEEAPASGEVRG